MPLTDVEKQDRAKARINRDLLQACRHGFLMEAQILVEEEGADMAFAMESHSPLTEACENGHAELVAWLVDKGVPLVQPGVTHHPLRSALSSGHRIIADYLMTAGIDVNVGGPMHETPLAWACLDGNADDVLWLLERGADPNARSQTGDSVLHWLSCSIVSVEEYGNCLDLLMEHGADPHVTDGEGRTVLDVLIEHNSQLPELQDLLHQAVVLHDARNLQAALSGTDVAPPQRERL